MLIAIANRSTLVSDTDVKLIAAACDAQIRTHAAPAWGVLPWGVYFAGKGPGAAWVPGSALLALVDEIPEAPDALGYHDEGPNGEVEGRIGVRVTLDGGTVHDGPQSVSAVISHEVLELFLDPVVDLWADAPDGYSYPRELCDAVQGNTYAMTPSAISVSNFLLPAWFDAKGKGPYDHLGVLKKPFTLAPGGYTVRRRQGTGVKEIFGARPTYKQSLRGARLLAGTQDPGPKTQGP